MATITAGSSKTFTAQVDNSSFVVIAPGGSIGQVVDQNGNTQAIDPNGTRRTFGPLNELQSITVSMQIGNASVELNGWSGGIPITAETNSTGQTVLDDASRAVLSNSGISANGYKASLMADSRTADYHISGKRTQGRSWVAQANAYMGNTLDVVAEYANSGDRSDQYFAYANFAPMLTDGSHIAIIGYPFVNDISQAGGAGYTDVDGNAVTLANVQQIVMARHLDRVRQLLNAGKIVIVCTEPGATSLGSSAVGVVHSINAAMRQTYQGMLGVHLFDPVDQIWSRSTTATSISFKSGYSADGTHATTRQGSFVGLYAATDLFPRILTKRKSYGTDPLNSSAQLYPNAGYLTATGGTVQQMTGTDPIPANLLLRAAVNGLASYTASVTTAEDGTGNELTLNITSTGATTVRLDHTGSSVAGIPYTAAWVGGLDVEVVSSSGCRAYGAMQLFTNQGTEEGYILYAGDAADVWTANGKVAPARWQSDPTTPPAGSSSGLAPQYRLWIDFKSAGSIAIKVKNPTIYRI